MDRRPPRHNSSARELRNRQPLLGLEMLEGRSLWSAAPSVNDELFAAAATVAATPHQKHVKHVKHVAHVDHVDHIDHVDHVAHVRGLKHDRHLAHQAHVAHVLRTTHPEPPVLTALERNDWPTIREAVMSNRPRVSN